MLGHPRHLFLILLPLALAAACKTTGTSNIQAAAVGTPDFASLAKAGAATLEAKYNAYPIQTNTDGTPDCHALIVPADPSVPFVGTALLLHGYTACPQQYEEMASILAKKGVQSFAPLLPGQGRGPVPTPDLNQMVNGQAFKDYYGAYLPSVRNNDWQRYQQFVADVNAFMTTVPGPKFVSGLSVGGALATYAYAQTPGLYQRALLTSPFYGVAGSYLGHKPSNGSGISVGTQLVAGDALYLFEDWVLKDLVANMQLVGGYGISWGAICYQKALGNQTVPGRRGICDSKLENVAGVHTLGAAIVGGLPQLPAASLPQIQYIFAEFDPTANTILNRQAAAVQLQLAGGDTTKVNLCTYPPDVPHSFFARSDIFLTFPDPYWLNGFLQMSTNFLAYGDPVTVDAAPSEEHVYDLASKADGTQTLNRCDTTKLTNYADVYQRRAASSGTQPAAATTPASQLR